MNQKNKSDMDQRLLSDQFPHSSAYHPDWVIAGGMGSNTLWLTERLTSAMELKPGMRVLDLGCGRALSSIFLAREFDTLNADQGQNLGYIRMVGRRRGDAALVDYCWPDSMRSFPEEHAAHPMLRTTVT